MARMAHIVDGIVINLIEANDLSDLPDLPGIIIPAGDDVSITDEYNSTTGVFSKIDVSIDLTSEEIAELMAPIPLAIVEE
jgi:hypothetical protein